MDAALSPVAVDEMEVHLVELRLATPFATSSGVRRARPVVMVRVRGPHAEGWGECAALAEPTYTEEYAIAALEVIERHLVPRLAASCVASSRTVALERVAEALAPVRGHRMAKSAVEMAVLDAALRQAGIPFATWLGVTAASVPAGAVVGMVSGIGELTDAVGEVVAAGYGRVRMKIAPGWDVEPVAAVREAFPSLALQVDANGAYPDVGAALEPLRAMDAMGLACVEQPLPPEALLASRRLADQIATPICLDEPVTSAPLAEACLALGACSIVCVKPGRVGGYMEAVRVHDLCRGLGAPAWVGGNHETGLGRAANVALAGLPGFSMPADLAVTGRGLAEELTEPVALVDGRLAVPAGPGFGVELDVQAIEAASAAAVRIAF